MSRSRSLAAALAFMALTVLAEPPAWAHVSVDPGEAPKGGFAKLSFRVPNERADAGTSRVQIFLPADHPIASVSVKAQPGWAYEVSKTKLPTPIKDEGESVTEAVSAISWTGGPIKPGEFAEFEISAGPMPTDTDELVFKVLQTYEGGEVVRWIDETPEGGAEPEHPAAVLDLTAATSDHHAGSPPSEPDGHTAGGASGKAATKKDVDGVRSLAVAALALAAAGLAIGLGAARRSRTGTAATGEAD